LAEGQEKRAAVRQMFGEIAPTYDLLNSIMSLRLHHRWRAAAVRKLEIQAGEQALDLCCGTGDFITPLLRTGARVVGMDFCMPMLQVARKKGFHGLSLADACNLPLRSESVDAVTVGWGIRNVPDIDAAHAEIARVLKSGGRFVSLDMAQPRGAFLRGASHLVFNKLVPLMGSLFGKTKAYTYLPKSTEKFWSREQLAESMGRAGMTEVGFKDLFFGNICMHWGRKG
jgi:demethylmenaquinone methyltransferase / 2-methoxy-6-polyprenyl-1,4-benzoquinol methylase